MVKRPSVRRGDVWRVVLDPVVGSEQAKTRPCVVVQRDAANAVGRTTIVVPFTDAATQKAFSVSNPRILAGDGGLTKDSAALCSQVRVVDRLRLSGENLGSLSVGSLSLIDLGLVEILDLGHVSIISRHAPSWARKAATAPSQVARRYSDPHSQHRIGVFGAVVPRRAVSSSTMR